MGALFLWLEKGAVGEERLIFGWCVRRHFPVVCFGGRGCVRFLPQRGRGAEGAENEFGELKVLWFGMVGWRGRGV